MSLKSTENVLSLTHLCTIMVFLISLGTINFMLLKEMYSAYGDKYAFFVNQGVNALYIVFGGLILYPRMWFTDVVTAEMKSAEKGRFVLMATFDAFGTFFTAMGAVHTPGSMQPILNQMLIPFTICISVVYLKKVFRFAELSGALLIAAGACLSALPAFIAERRNSDVTWYSVVIYAMSNLPMAASSCYKQKNFRDQEFDVWYLTQWVSIFQFLISFAFIPMLLVPGFGSAEGVALTEIPEELRGGWLCFMEQSEECKGRHTFLLLIAYCVVNVMYNTLGLYLTKVGSALLNAVSYALLLPNTTLLFFTPLVGPVQEPFTSYSWFTVAGLVIVLIGFTFYQHFARGVGTPENFEMAASPRVKSKQPAFQERVIGMGVAHGISTAKTTSADKPLLG